MDANNIIVSSLGVEDPKVHIISVNGNTFNVAIELQMVILIGASVISVNSEYRQFNLDSNVVNQLLNNNSSNKNADKLYHRIKKAIESKMKSNTITVGKTELKNVAFRGIDYAIIYYLLIKFYGYSEAHLVTLNSFTNVIPVLDIFDNILKSQKVQLIAADIKTFADHVMNYQDSGVKIGSKLFCITRYQVSNTTDLSESIWKSMYINRIIRNISLEQRRNLFSPSIGWGLLRCVAKQIFTNKNLIDQVSFGENIDYIRQSAIQQNELASELIVGQLYGNALDDIKKLTKDLKNATFDIDYSLGNLIITLFYKHTGTSLINEINNFVEECTSKQKLTTNNIVSQIFTDMETFKQLIFQYLYATFHLARHGIIHNDPHLNNVLITKNINRGTQKVDYFLSPGKALSMNHSELDMTLIDYDKSILSHHHTNTFEKTAKIINQELGIVFDSVKETISHDYNQVFNCYVMYDVVKFGLIMKTLLEDIDRSIGRVLSKNAIKTRIEFLDKMIKIATATLHKIYDTSPKFPFDYSVSHGSIEWLIMELYKDYAKVNKTKSSILNANQISKIKSSSMTDKPEFVSSRRKYVDALKYNFLSQYASKL